MTLGVRQQSGRGPLYDILITKGDAAQITGLHLRQANIDHRHLMFCGDLGHHLRFTYPGWPPEHNGCVMAFTGAGEFSLQYGHELCWAHVISYCKSLILYE